MKITRFILLFPLLAVAMALPAEEFILPPEDVGLIGILHTVQARQEDTLLDIARRHSLGQGEIVVANPGVDLWIPGEGTQLLLPTRFVLPDAPRRGLVLNLPEMRLYYYPKAAKNQLPKVITHPISIGRMDWKTPLGKTRVVAKQKDPAWRPPPSILLEAKEAGKVLPKIIPAGPDNPLGQYAMRLGLPGYLIHGTNKPYGLGMRVTHGCIRLYPEDIEQLFQQVAVGTDVQIVDQPVKLGWQADTLFIEVHPPLDEDTRREDLLRWALDMIHRERAGHPFILDGANLRQAVDEQRGVPVPISKPVSPRISNHLDKGAV